MLTIYKASAGAGKTYTLTLEYIRTLLGIKIKETGKYVLNSDKYAPGKCRRAHRHRNILAITFTNAATEEMKSRIVKQLDLLASGSPEAAYTDALTKAFGCTADELRQAAAKALSELLYDYSNFNVSTIDSFFQFVLRTFSREVDHQGDYELCMETADTVQQAVSLMLDELNYTSHNRNNRLFNWIKNYSLENLRAGNSYNLFDRRGTILKKLSKIVSDSMDETYGTYSNVLRNYLSNPQRLNNFDAFLYNIESNTYAGAKAAASQFFDVLKNAKIDAGVYGKPLLDRMNGVLFTPVKLTASQLKPTKPMKAAIDGEPVTWVSATNMKKLRGKEDIIAQADALACRFAIELDKAIPTQQIYKELRANLGLLDFIGFAQDTLDTFLRDNNLVLIGDTGELLKRIISDAEMPFIYERLGMQLTNLLIDEFQDTSRLQWHNLKPLVANSLADNNDNLIIGDEKQAIYRFRNSDSELLGSIVQNEDFPRSHILRGQSDADNTNHRSAGNIVRFNNSLFTNLAAVFGLSAYGNVAQTPAKRLADTPAYIRIAFSDKETEETEIFHRLAADILRQHEAGYSWHDILILVRNNSEGTRIVEFLMENYPQIRLLSSEALLLNSSAAVRSIMSMLKLISRSYEGHPLASTRSGLSYASQNDIVMTITRFNQYMSEGLDGQTALETALAPGSDESAALEKQIADIRKENPANLVALIEAIVANKLTPAQRQEEFAYIAALQDLAIKHLEGPNPSLAAFTAEYDRNIQKWAIKASSQTDAVEIMTVHKCKGLQRACVHIPVGDWNMHHSSVKLWVETATIPALNHPDAPPIMRLHLERYTKLTNPKHSPVVAEIEKFRNEETADNINLAYVAFTRAERELCVYSYRENLGAELEKALAIRATSSDNKFIDIPEFYNKETGVLEIGEPTKPAAKHVPMHDTCEAGEYIACTRTDINELVCIDDALGLDDADGEEIDKETVDTPGTFTGTPEMVLAAETGSQLHAILAGMRTLDELDESIKWQLAIGVIKEENVDDYRARLKDAIDFAGDYARDWFAPEWKVYAERAIYDPVNNESYRPDRVIVRTDGTCAVVDYKFTSEVRASHRRQVSNYVKLLEQMGRPGAEAYLWYPVMHKIIKV